MERLILKQEYVEAIKTDAFLYGKVAYILGLSPSSLPRYLYSNDVKLTQASVLRILRDHLGVTEDSELLTESKETAAA